MRASVLSDWLAQRLDRGNGQPIYRQLHRLLQQAILSRELPAGTKVPSSRLLANELGIARNTVTQVYEQLALEGYVTSTTGRGTFVADSAPDEIVGAPDAAPAAATPQPLSARRALSTRGARLIAGAGVSKRQWGAFMPGVPDVSKFPARVWSRLHTKYWRRLRPDLLTYAPGGGLALLRHALADYLRTSRSVRCTPEQIIITTGIHQSVDLAVRLLSDPGDVIWTEDPCYWGVRSVLHVSGLQSRPIAVDAEGINPSAEADAGYAFASVPARHGDEPRAPPHVARIRAPASMLDHRGRLRQRVSLRQPSTGVAAGVGYGGAGDLCGQFRQDAVSRLADRLPRGA
jgi:GntR family transcriptional regulator/MocR family aminotransferase